VRAFLAKRVQHWSEPAFSAAVDDELDNVRAALRYALDHGMLPAGPRLAWQLGPYWYVRGNYEEGRMWLDEALSLPGAADGPDGAWAHAEAGLLARLQADLASAADHLLAAQATLQRYPNELCTASTLNYQADVALDRGDLQRARKLYEQGRALSRRIGYTELEAIQTTFPAQVLLMQDNVDAAAPLARDALELADRAASRWARGWAQWTLGEVAALRGDLELARRLLEEVVDGHRAMGYTHDLRNSLIGLARVVSDQGAVVHAAGLLSEGLRLAIVSAPAPHTLLLLEELAGLAVVSQPLTAVRLAAAAEAHRAGLGIKRRPIEDKRFSRTMARATESCDTPAFQKAWAEGSRLTTAQANQEALDLTARFAALASDQPISSSAADGYR